MNLSKESFQTIPEGDRFLLFVDGTATGVYTILHGRHFIQLSGGHIACTTQKFIDHYTKIKEGFTNPRVTIFPLTDIREPIERFSPFDIPNK